MEKFHSKTKINLYFKCTDNIFVHYKRVDLETIIGLYDTFAIAT